MAKSIECAITRMKYDFNADVNLENGINPNFTAKIDVSDQWRTGAAKGIERKLHTNVGPDSDSMEIRTIRLAANPNR